MLSQGNLTQSGSHFFRGDNWDFFHDECLPAFEGAEHMDVWCAGCSKGQEAYSTLVMLLDYVPLESIGVLAADYNRDLLPFVEEGSYFNMHLWEVPERYWHYLHRGERKFAFAEELRAVVRTDVLNLITDDYPGPFDTIVCRNVIKFFSPDIAADVKARLAASLKPGGYLYVSTDGAHGGRELIGDPAALGLEEVGDGRGIYRKL